MQDDWLDRVLDRVRRMPDASMEGAAARIVARATAMPQRRGLRRVAALTLIRLTSPWPYDLAPKAALLATVAVMMFAVGLGDADSLAHLPDAMAMAYGSFDDGGML